MYGTLKKGFHNHYLIEDSEFLGVFNTYKKMSLYKYKNFDFPYLTEEENEFVSGEIYVVNEKLLTELDIFEEVPTLFIRKKIGIMFHGVEVKAWAYIIEDFNENTLSLQCWNN